MITFIRKMMALAVPAAAGLLLFAAVASAHVTVSPAMSGTGAWETYTLKVPSEKDSPTVQVDLRIPEGASFKQYEATPGWEVTVEGNKVSWKATGEGILAGQFQRFYFTVQNPASAATLAWDAYQHYADGTLVQWSGDEGSETPHSVTEIMETASDGDHGHGSMDMGSGMDMDMDMSDHDMSGSSNDKSSSSAVSYIALIVAGLSLLVAFISVFRGRSE